ncbi:MAG: hypothetical protein ACW99Q_23740 [Candidatus Kariarchaeaceae archaeon]|jgi:hypothetical protein
MEFNENLLTSEFPKFLQGPYLKATLTMLPNYAEKEIKIIVPYLIQSDILDAIVGIPESISVKMYTRDRSGYLNINFEAGIISIKQEIISDVEKYFAVVDSESKRIH